MEQVDFIMSREIMSTSFLHFETLFFYAERKVPHNEADIKSLRRGAAHGRKLLSMSGQSNLNAQKERGKAMIPAANAMSR